MSNNDKATSAPKKRANSVIATTRDGDKVHFDVAGIGRLTVDLKKVSQPNLEYAAFHGIKQRVVDAAAIAWDGIGQRPTPADKYAEMVKIVEHLNSGSDEWNTRGTGGGGAVGGVTLKAVAAIQGVEVDVMRARIEELAEKRELTTKQVLAKLAQSPDVIRKIAELRAAASPVDADDLLGELEG